MQQDHDDSELILDIQKLYETTGEGVQVVQVVQGVQAAVEQVGEGSASPVGVEAPLLHQFQPPEPTSFTEQEDEPEEREGKLIKRPRHTWSTRDDTKILEALLLFGPKWRHISRYLQAWTDDAIRNRVLRMQTEKLEDEHKHVVQALQTQRREDREAKRVERAESQQMCTADASSPQPWTSDEDSKITQYLERRHKHPSWNTIQRDLLPSRTPHAIRNRAYRIGVFPKQHGEGVHAVPPLACENPVCGNTEERYDARMQQK